MKIGGNFPAIPQSGVNYTSRSKVPAVVEQESSSQPSITEPSTMQSFERANRAESANFFKVDSLSAFAQQAINAYQSTEALSPSNPRHQLIGIDVYA